MSQDQVFECNSHQFSSLHFVHYHPANLIQHCAAKPSPFCHLDLLQHEHLEDHQEQRQRLGSLEQKTGKEIDLQFDYNYK